MTNAVKMAFLDRDGTLIREPADNQVDSLAKVSLVPGVIPALLRLRDAGFEFVMVSNQDGLGTDSFPEEHFRVVQDFVVRLFASQGIAFREIFICPHTAEDGCGCRKPLPGLLGDFLARVAFDRGRSFMAGDRATDLEFARNIGVRGFRIDPDDPRCWEQLAHEIVDVPRRARVSRTTRETAIEVDVDLDGDGTATVATGIGFFDHMLDQVARHSGATLAVRCTGDLAVDEHHTVEDVALALGEAIRQALGDKRGIGRFGFVLPMDEAEASVSIDLSGRPFLAFDGSFPRPEVGRMPTELVPHFFRSLAESLGATLHVSVRGENTHHMVESCFKATGRALRQAFARSGTGLPSTKGVL